MEELSGEREVHKREKKKQWKREKKTKDLTHLNFPWTNGVH